jgi:hypothetical protein
MKNWTIILKEVPHYTDFEGEFVEPLDYHIGVLLMECELLNEKGKPIITTQMKTHFKNTVLEKIKKSTGELVVKHNNTAYKLGRYYANDNISIIPHSRYIKHTMLNYLNWSDLDMVKGHPSIAVLMGESVGKIYNSIKFYVENFDAVAKILIEFYSIDEEGEEELDNGDIKMLFNMMIYGGGFSTWKTKLAEDEPLYGKVAKKIKNENITHELVLNYKAECDHISKRIYTDNPSLVRKLKKDDEPTWKTKGRLMSYWFQTIENHIIYICYQFLVEKGIIKKKRCGLEFDGLCIPPINTEIDKAKLTEDINTIIELRTGLPIKMKFKDYDEKNILIDIIEKRKALVIATQIEPETIVVEASEINEVEKNSIIGILDGDDNRAANIIIENYPHWKYCNQQLYVFDDKTGMWSTNRAIQNNIIGNLANKLNIIKMTKDGYEYTGKNYANCHNKRKDVYEYIHQKTVDDDWILRSQHKSLGKILFTNGIYDFRKSIFISSELNGFDPEIVFYCRIDHDFTHFSDDDMAYIETIRERLFYLPLGKDVGNYVILNLARGLAGDMMKRVMFGLGMSNTGKGIMTKALQLSCGQYVDTFNAENLAYSSSSSDEAQKLRWAYLLQFKRIIISNEITNDKPLNGNIMKKVCSGGDALKGRLHGGLETSFVPQFLSVILANDIPEIKPYDDAMINRVRVYSYTKSFVDEPQNDFELKKDPELEDEMQTLKFQRCFVGMLLMSYLNFNDVLKRVEIEPNEVMMAKKNWMGDDKDNNMMTKFQLTYEITNDASHFVKSNDIEKWVVSTKETSYRKFVMELKKYAVIHKLDNINNNGKKIDKKNVQGWRGIQLIVENFDDTEFVEEEE